MKKILFMTIAKKNTWINIIELINALYNESGWPIQLKQLRTEIYEKISHAFYKKKDENLVFS
jgi:hypothetical protein